eukprot:1653098-Prymnesium_polylepis.1
MTARRRRHNGRRLGLLSNVKKSNGLSRGCASRAQLFSSDWPHPRPRASQPFSKNQLESAKWGWDSGAEFPKAGFQEQGYDCPRRSRTSTRHMHIDGSRGSRQTRVQPADRIR